MPPTTSQLADKITIQPVAHDQWPARPTTYVETIYIRITLDLRTGHLAAHADPGYRGVVSSQYSAKQHFAPYSWIHHYEFTTPVPEHITWLVRKHVSAVEAEKLLTLVAARAQHILTGLAPVEGRTAGGHDWTLQAAAAVEAIDGLLWNPWHALHTESPINADWTVSRASQLRGLATLHDMLTALPELVDDSVAAMSDEELDAKAAQLARASLWSLRTDDVMRAAHLDPADSADRSTPIYLVGVLSELYRLRAERSQGLTPCDASEWFGKRSERLDVVTDCTTDAELAELATAEEQAAAAERLRLLGAVKFMAKRRAMLRDRVRAELRDVGKETADMENELAELRARRAALLLRVDGWDDPADGTPANRNAELSRLAVMSRQAVRAIREKAMAVDASHDDD